MRVVFIVANKTLKELDKVGAGLIFLLSGTIRTREHSLRIKVVSPIIFQEDNYRFARVKGSEGYQVQR